MNKIKLPIMYKIMKDLMREKTFVFALLLQILLILSITIVLGFTSLFFSPESLIVNNINIGTIDVGNFNELLIEEKNIKLKTYSSLEEGLLDFEKGDIDSVIFREGDLPYKFTIYVPESEIQSSIILALLKEKFENYEDHLRHRTLETDAIPLNMVDIVGVRGKGSEYIFEILYGFLIPFIFLVPIFLVGSLVIDTLTQEIEQKTIHILFTATESSRIYFEILLGGIFLALIQSLLWLFLIYLRGITISNPIGILLYIILITSLFVLLAILISISLKIKMRAQLVYSLVVILISVTSNIISFNPVNVISKMIIGIQSIGVLSYIVPLFLIFLIIFILTKYNFSEKLI